MTFQIANSRARVLVGGAMPLAAAALLFGNAALAQGRPGPQSPQAVAPIDLTGYWVAVVTEDWRWRMMTPPPGDYASVPMTAAAREVADGWNLEADVGDGNACRPYGAGGIMRVPTRLHISWEDSDTLKIETDAGSQTRLLHFGAFTPAAQATWQGNSSAEWEFTGGGRGQPPTGGSLKVVTTDLKMGYVRWNGVPYGENAVVTEYFDYHPAFGQEWFTVATLIDDPEYFTEPFLVSNHFRKEADGANWNPTPCVTEPPVRDTPAESER
jgi:hypothetical protein